MRPAPSIRTPRLLNARAWGAIAVVLGAVLLSLASPAAADQRSYVGHNDCFKARPCAIGDKAQDPIVCGVGVVCFAGGHIWADDQGKGSVSISDAVFSPMTGFACQDLDSDNLCGEVGSELSEPFCGAATLGNGDLWEPAGMLFVFIGGLTTSQDYCGIFHAGVEGTVSHS